MLSTDELKVSVNWDELVKHLPKGEKTPQRPKPPAPEDESPIRYTASNARGLRSDSDYSPRRHVVAP